jgi:4-hydroxy-tetrahydrodipicolinate synthase
VKFGAELVGQASAEMRLPMVPIAEGSKKAVREAMIHAGLIN